MLYYAHDVSDVFKFVTKFADEEKQTLGFNIRYREFDVDLQNLPSTAERIFWRLMEERRPSWGTGFVNLDSVFRRVRSKQPVKNRQACELD